MQQIARAMANKGAMKGTRIGIYGCVQHGEGCVITGITAWERTLEAHGSATLALARVADP